MPNRLALSIELDPVLEEHGDRGTAGDPALSMSYRVVAFWCLVLHISILKGTVEGIVELIRGHVEQLRG